MRLFVLGATGRTGVELVDLALAEGHEVTAFVRSPHKIVRRDQRLDVVKGDPRNVSALVEALPGHDAVLSALGPAPREAMTVSTLLRESAASTVQAMKTAGVPRLAVVSSALLFLGGGPLVALGRRVLRPHLEDLRAMEARVQASDTAWTIARPPRLTPSGDQTYRAQADALPGGLNLRAWLSWRGVAAFLLDSLGEGRWVRQVVGLAH